MVSQTRKQQITGWVAVSLSVAAACFWAFWGIIENFHEGWYHHTLLSNLGLMVVQYLTPMIIFMIITLISITWPHLGAVLHIIAAGGAIWFFHAFTNPGLFILIIPLVGLGILYGVGRPQPRHIARALAVSLPLTTLIIAGIGPAIRVAGRIDDGDRRARLVTGNGVNLIWAPQGPGWPQAGGSWHEAQQTCQHLSEDGLTLEASAQHIWRLPTIDEAVRSMARHGQNSEGIWDAETGNAIYSMRPDKESPLWDVHSPVIYWWTSTEIDEQQAYIIVYDGKVWPRSKELKPDYLGFRCVESPYD